MIVSSSSEFLRQFFDDSEKNVLRKDIEFEEKFIPYFDLEQYLYVKKDEISLDILYKLYSTVENLVKDKDPTLAKNATVDIICKFLNVPNILNSHHLELKEKYGNFSFNTTKILFSLVKEFEKTVNSEIVNIMSNSMPSQDNGIRCRKPCTYTRQYDRSKLCKMSIKDPNELDIVKNFSMLYTNENTNKAKKKNSTPKEKQPEDVFKVLTQYNTTVYPDETFFYKIVDLLTSPKDFKTQLFQYIGHENIKLYEFVQRNRIKLIMKSQELTVKKPGQPSYRIQITVQSKQEKDLLKKIRKLEKKSKQK